MGLQVRVGVLWIVLAACGSSPSSPRCATCEASGDEPAVAPPICGDGIREAGEVCDDAHPDDRSVACATLSAPGLGAATCTGCVWNTRACVPTCGDEMLSAGEVCDGGLLGATSCLDLGYEGGTLACATCEHDARGCTGTITIEVKLGGQPVAGAPVAIADADGISVTSLETGADGRATATVTPGSYVTAGVVRPSGAHVLTTFTGIDPGDHVVIATPDWPSPPAQQVGTMTTSFPSPLPGGVYQYARTACGGSMNPVTWPEPVELRVFDSCVDPQGRITRFAELLDAELRPLGYELREDLVFAPTIADAVTSWSQLYTTLTCRLAQSPAGSTSLSLGGSAKLGSVVYPWEYSSITSTPVAGQTYEHVLPVPSVTSAQMGCYAIMSGPSGSTRECNMRTNVGGAAAVTVEIPGSGFVQQLSNLASGPLPGQVSWSEGPPSGSPDFTLVSATLGTGRTWNIYAGPQVTSVRFPEMPLDARFDAFRGAITPSWLEKTDYESLVGYEALKAYGPLPELDTRLCRSYATR